ncbi:hypothetical protein ACOSP7_004403 [Xanthoceras sorbifolium]
MRLSPPSQGSFREALNDFVFNGFSIPKGNGPTPYTFVPFRGGPKMCPEKEYVRFQILVSMNNVVKRFKWEKLIPNEKIIVKPVPIALEGHPVHLIPHKA